MIVTACEIIKYVNKATQSICNLFECEYSYKFAEKLLLKPVGQNSSIKCSGSKFCTLSISIWLFVHVCSTMLWLGILFHKWHHANKYNLEWNPENILFTCTSENGQRTEKGMLGGGDVTMTNICVIRAYRRVGLKIRVSSDRIRNAREVEPRRCYAALLSYLTMIGFFFVFFVTIDRYLLVFHGMIIW